VLPARLLSVQVICNFLWVLALDSR